MHSAALLITKRLFGTQRGKAELRQCVSFAMAPLHTSCSALFSLSKACAISFRSWLSSNILASCSLQRIYRCAATPAWQAQDLEGRSQVSPLPSQGARAYFRSAGMTFSRCTSSCNVSLVQPFASVTTCSELDSQSDCQLTYVVRCQHRSWHCPCHGQPFHQSIQVSSQRQTAQRYQRLTLTSVTFVKQHLQTPSWGYVNACS